MRKAEFAVEELEDLEPLATKRNVEERRWYNIHHVIYEINDRLWRFEEYEGSTEMQEIGRWHPTQDVEFVEGVEVEEIRRLVLDYVPYPADESLKAMVLP